MVVECCIPGDEWLRTGVTVTIVTCPTFCEVTYSGVTANRGLNSSPFEEENARLHRDGTFLPRQVHRAVKFGEKFWVSVIPHVIATRDLLTNQNLTPIRSNGYALAGMHHLDSSVMFLPVCFRTLYMNMEFVT